MSITIQCPNPACGKAGALPDEEAGQVVYCPHCRTRFTAPAPPPVHETMVGHPTLARGKEAPSTVAPSPNARGGSTGHTPDKIGRFQIRALLGAGAAGTVYRAFDPHLERDVALKVPQTALVDNPQHIERFLREAKAAAQLRHPHIVPLFEAGRQDSIYYIASAFIEGQTLAQMMHQERPDFRATARIIRDLAEALDYAHEQGIVHRDVKPANVMMDAKKRAHLMDFGLAHRQEFLKKLTHDGAVLGTPAYMAPEQAQGRTGDPLPASDQYSLGVVMYELLAGQLPFAGARLEVLLFNVMNSEPTPPRKVRNRIPSDLETICLKAMAKRPQDRYPDCKEMAKDLRRWLDGEPIRGRRLDAWDRAWQWCRRQPALAATSTAVVILLLMVVILMSGGPPTPVTPSDKQLTTVAPEARPKEAEPDFKKEVRAALDKAEAAFALAEKARLALMEKTKLEEAARKQVDSLQQELDKSREAEEAARLREEAALVMADKNLGRYAQRLALADLELAAGNTVRAHEYLADTPPALRNWEWHHLSRRAGGDAFTVNSFGGFSSDGKHYASLDTGQLEICDSSTGKVLLTCNTGTNLPSGVAKMAWSASGYIAYLNSLWDGKTGVQKLAFAKEYNSLAFSADGKKFALGLFGSVAVYDTANGTQLHSLQVPSKQIGSLAFAPKGDRLIAAAGSEAKIWELAKGQELSGLAWTGQRFLQVSFSPDGKRAAVVASGRLEKDADVTYGIKVWDVASGAVVFTSSSPERIQAISISSDGRMLASAHRAPAAANRGTIRLWDIGSGRTTSSTSMSAAVTGVAYRPDGKLLAYVQYTSAAPSKKAAKGKAPKDMKAAPKAERWGKVITVQAVGTDSVKADAGGLEKSRGSSAKLLSFSQDGETLASLWGSNTLQIHRCADGSLLFNQKLSGECYYITLSPKGKLLGLLAKPKQGEKGPDQLVVLDVQSGKAVFTPPIGLHDKTYMSVSFSGDEQRIAFAGPKGTLLCALATGAVLHSFPEPGRLLTFSADGAQLASAAINGVSVFSISERKKVIDLPVVGMDHLAFDSTGDRLATLAKGTLGVWDIKTGKQLAADGEARFWFRVAGDFSRDGKRKLQIAGGYVTLLDAAGDQLMHVLRGSTAFDGALFSPAGHRIATTSGNDLRFWDGSPVR